MFCKNCDFYPRPPGGGRPGARTIVQLDLYHFYPRPPGGGRQKYFYVLNLFFIISIHALRVEGDAAMPGKPKFMHHFYPRPPGGGRLEVRHAHSVQDDFYPRPPGGGRHKSPWALRTVFGISTHALRVEGDRQQRRDCGRKCISIHALRVEGDASCEKLFISTTYFYPRPPGGGRRTKEGQDVESFRISIHALRVEGDPRVFGYWLTEGISIHALRVEGDHRGDYRRVRPDYFYPRPPGGGRR